MTKTKQRVPKLRFSEFEGEWEERPIKNILSRVGSSVKVDEDKMYREIGIRSHGKGLFHKPFVTGSSLGNKRVFHVHVPAFVVNIVFAWEHAIALTSNEEEGFIASHRFPMFVSKKNNANLYFVKYYFIRKYGKHLLELASPGGAGRNKTLGQKYFENTKVVFPSTPEQQKISFFLTSVDTKIEVLTKKKQLLEKYKNGIIQKLFSQEIRFRDDEGNEFPEWGEKKLGEISEKPLYGMNAASKKYDGENKYIRITDIDENSNEYNPCPLTSPSGELDKKYLLNKGDIVFARTGASTGKSYLYKEQDGKIYFAGFLIKFSIKEADPRFVHLQTLRHDYQKWVSVMSIRSGQPGINAEEYSRLKILAPFLPEQKKIAQFLSAIDQKIDLVSKELEKSQSFKKGLLQQMFV